MPALGPVIGCGPSSPRVVPRSGRPGSRAEDGLVSTKVGDSLPGLGPGGRFAGEQATLDGAQSQELQKLSP